MIVVYLDHYEWFLRITDDDNEPIKAEISGTKRSGYNAGINNDILTTPCSEQHRQLSRTNLKIQAVVSTAIKPSEKSEGFCYAAAFALISSIIFLMPSQTLISVNTSTMLPLSVKGDS